MGGGGTKPLSTIEFKFFGRIPLTINIKYLFLSIRCWPPLKKNLQCLSQHFILIFVVLRRGEVQLHDGESNTGGQGWLQGIRTVRTRKEFNDISNAIFNLYLEHSLGESALYSNVGCICTARFVKIVSSAIFKTLNGNVSYPQIWYRCK